MHKDDIEQMHCLYASTIVLVQRSRRKRCRFVENAVTEISTQAGVRIQILSFVEILLECMACSQSQRQSR